MCLSTSGVGRDSQVRLKRKSRVYRFLLRSRIGTQNGESTLRERHSPKEILHRVSCKYDVNLSFRGFTYFREMSQVEERDRVHIVSTLGQDQ